MSRVTESPRREPRQRIPLVSLIGADGVSEVGNLLTAMAIPWLVLQTTGSAAQAGIAVAAGTVAILIGGFFGGVVVDRLGPKRASIVADLASGVTVALIPLLQQTVGLAFWQLLALVFLGALLDTPGRTARQSLIPSLAPLAGYRLERVNATVMMVGRLALLLTPPAAGILIAVIGTTNVLWIDAATFLISAAIIAVAIPGRAATPATVDIAEEPNGYLEEIRVGLRFLRQDRLLFWLVLSFSLGNLIAEPVYSLILPVYANEVFNDPVALGLMFSALAAGSLLGNVLFLALAARLPRRATILTGFTVRALTFWALPTMPPLPVIAGSIVVNATFLEPANPIVRTVYQERIPERLRGRVFGTMYSLSAGARSLGIILYGFLLQELGLQTTLIVMAAANVLVPLIMFVIPAYKELDAPPAPAQS
ncbi:MAG: MFS transporter [Chloroflexota bacterium]|nr:MFS transporter [Chloroflexota bacterium]